MVTFRGFDNDTVYTAPNTNDLIYGNGGNDVLRGRGGRDRIFGGTGADRLFGDAGDDQLFGGEGRDELYGGNGFDRMWGGDGADRFVFQFLSEDDTGIDQIRDFSNGEGDRIDVSAIDANSSAGGNQAFRFIGERAFSGEPGELRYRYIDLNGDEFGGVNTLVQLNVDGGATVELTIQLTGVYDFTAGSFVL
jgi:serralysin